MKLTKIEQLRRKYEGNQISLVDVVKLFDHTKNKILTDFITAEVIKENQNLMKADRRYIEEYTIEHMALQDRILVAELTRNCILSSVVHRVFEMIGDENRYYIKRFNKYWEENKLPSKDMSHYPDLNAIKVAVDRLDIAEFTKNKEIQAEKIYEDDNWLIIVPLSIKASQLYGSGTKWCTASRERDYQYYEHTQNGILVYLINKVTSAKYAYFKTADADASNPGNRISQFYNTTDAFVDSIDLDIPDYVMTLLRTFVKAPPYKKNCDFPNYDNEGLKKFKENQCVKEAAVPTDDVVNHTRTEPMAQPADPINVPARGMAAEFIEDVRAGMRENAALTTERNLDYPVAMPA